MKINKITVPIEILFGKSKELYDYMSSINFLDYYKKSGVYVIHNKKLHKYYVGSTSVNYWYRLSAAGTSHHNYFNHDKHGFINRGNINEFDVIFLVNSDIYNIRIYETKLIRLLKSYESKFGYNHTINGQRREDLKGQKCKWVTNGKVDSMILETDSIPDGWWKGRTNHGLYSNKARTGSYQITNGPEDKSLRGLILPEGFYPGRYGSSYVKKFFDNWEDKSLELRNKLIYEGIEELHVKVPRKFITSLGHPVWEFMQHSRVNFKRFYNIIIDVE